MESMPLFERGKRCSSLVNPEPAKAPLSGPSPDAGHGGKERFFTRKEPECLSFRSGHTYRREVCAKLSSILERAKPLHRKRSPERSRQLGLRSFFLVWMMSCRGIKRCRKEKSSALHSLVSLFINLTSWSSMRQHRPSTLGPKPI